MSKTDPIPPALPSPVPLPSLTSALSRRAALFGAMTVGAASMASLPALAAPAALDPADARLVALASEYEALHRQVHATHSIAVDYDTLIAGYGPLEDELASTQAQTVVGLLAKARALQIPACRECASPELGNSLADDLVRLHVAGVL